MLLLQTFIFSFLSQILFVSSLVKKLTCNFQGQTILSLSQYVNLWYASSGISPKTVFFCYFHLNLHSFINLVLIKGGYNTGFLYIQHTKGLTIVWYSLLSVSSLAHSVKTLLLVCIVCIDMWSQFFMKLFWDIII